MNQKTSNWLEWLNTSRFEGQSTEDKNNSKKLLLELRNIILINSKIKKYDTVIDLGTGTGLLGLKVLEAQAGCGNVIFLDSDVKCLEECRKQIEILNIKEGYKIVQAPCECIPLDNNSVNKAIMRAVLAHIKEKEQAVKEIHRILKKDGIFCGLEPVISENPRYWQILSPQNIKNYEYFKDIENKIWNDKTDSVLDFNTESLNAIFKNANFADVTTDRIKVPIIMNVTDSLIDSWFEIIPAPNRPCLKERFLKFVKEDELDSYINDIKKALSGKRLESATTFVLIKAVK